jgi:hypothetical protein
MDGQPVRSVAVAPPDAAWVADVVGRWHCTERWSAVWARTPSPHALTELLWQGVVCQETVMLGDEPIGLLQVSDVDVRHGHASLDLLLDPDHADRLEGAVQRFVDRAFHELSLRKLCLAAASGDLTLPRPLTARAHTVGTLREHRRRSADRFVDVHLYEIWSTGGPR